jgi:hypothetical protein
MPGQLANVQFSGGTLTFHARRERHNGNAALAART